MATGRDDTPSGAASAGPASAAPGAAAQTHNVNVLRLRSLITPRQMKSALPATPAATQTIVESRATVERILGGVDERLLVVLGPCSIHDEQAAYEYAERLADCRAALGDRLYLVMRVYFEKPRTTVGWKGLINDPHLNGSFDIEAGLRKARRILLRIAELGLPTGTEMLDPITPQYIADLVTWSAIGARTTESQTHRQMASGLSMPVGFKNGTDGNLQVALDALRSAGHPHSFLGIDEDGRTAIIDTRGNPATHLILRGGRSGTNYESASVAEAVAALGALRLPARIMIDCSHANSCKQHQNQARAWTDVVRQRAAGNRAVIGLMLESNLHEGSQPLGDDPAALAYGVSITDACIGWVETATLLASAHAALG